jgi:hypothetical protein
VKVRRNRFGRQWGQKESDDGPGCFRPLPLLVQDEEYSAMQCKSKTRRSSVGLVQQECRFWLGMTFALHP